MRRICVILGIRIGIGVLCNLIVFYETYALRLEHSKTGTPPELMLRSRRLARSNFRAPRLLPALLFLLSLVWAGSGHAVPNTSIFILHSYSQEYPWTKRQHEGFLRELSAKVPDMIDVNVEYLDTKRVPFTAAYAISVASHIAQKYAELEPKFIYVTDDNALLFALNQLTKIFPKAPIFFSGINDYGMKKRIDPRHVTGIFENKEIAPNLELMRQLAPGVRNILVVGDESETYQAIHQEIVTELKHQSDIHAEFLSGSRIEQLVKSLQGRQEQFVFLTTLGAISDPTGRTLTLPETVSAIVQAGPFIVISMEDVYLYPGVLGGYVTSGYRQGAAAADLSARYLTGTAVSDIKPIEASPNEYIIDGSELDKRGLALPIELAGRATILNPAPALYERNPKLIMNSLYAFAALFVALLLASVYVLMRKNRQIARTSQDLAAQSQQVRTVIEGFPVVLWAIDRKGIFTLSQGAGLKGLGLVPDEAVGKSLFEMYRDFPGIIDNTRQALTGESHVAVNWIGDLAFETYYAPLRDAKGDIAGATGVSADVTERKRTDAALQESESRYRTMIEWSPEAIVVHRNGRLIYVNPAAIKMFGAESGQDLLGKPILDLIHPDFHQVVLARIKDHVGNGTASPMIEEKFLKLDGTVIDVEIQGVPIIYDGEPAVHASIRDITERRNIEVALRAGQEKLRSLYELSTLGIALTDFKGRYIEFNEAFRNICGYPEEELKTLDYWALTPKKYFADEARQLESLQRTGHYGPYEKEYVRKDGSSVPLRLNGVIVTGRDGERHIWSIVEDITERKHAETAINLAAQRLQIALEGSQISVWETDLRTNQIWLDASWAAFLGMPRMDTRSNAIELLNVVHPDDHQAAIAAAVRVQKGEIASYSVEQRVKTTSGEWRWILSRGRVIERDATGRPLRVSGTNTDITERKQADEKLHLAASVFSHAREGIVITDPNGAIIDVNDTFTHITGFSREEVLGHNPRVLGSGRHSKEFYAAMWRDLLEKGHWSGEIWNRRKNGEVYAEMLTISAVRDPQGHTRQYVALFFDITSSKEHEAQLEHIAHYDALTGLPNRALLADRLHQAMAQAHRRAQPLAVAYLDLDGFKTVNDRHGHSAGDQLLVTMASRMKQALREGDTLSRLGGDEFVAVMLDLPDVQASVPMLTRLLAAAAQPVRVGELVLKVSASVGVTFYPQPEDVDADQLLRQADQAMYQAKLAGKKRYHVFDAEQDRSVRGHHESLERIRHALTRGEFVLYYQPKVNMRTGNVIGAEALIRWQHPEKGLLPPAAFLPMIEDHPLAVDIGEWVIDSALTQMAHWSASGLDIPVSVNVGARQLQQTGFPERLREILARHPEVRAGKLELEVLETSALEDVIGVSQIIDACRKIGVTFALDDFGTGYSSLTYLKRLPVGLLKIDQSFVRDMLEDPDDLAILEGVIGLATAFRRQVIAEGVETVEHGEMLLQLGCEQAQGYGIGRPMPASELIGWSNNWRPDPAWINCPQVSRDNLPLLFACVEHRAWVARIEAFVVGEREVPSPLDHHQCNFGRWLDTEGLANRGAQHDFQSIQLLHLQVHTLAAELREIQLRGPNSEALERLGDLHGLRDTLLEQMKALAWESRH
jgi:diguanylate cyclase (GGDEF)-like protein/PAS domain S-box-containing protein